MNNIKLCKNILDKANFEKFNPVPNDNMLDWSKHLQATK